MISTLTGALVRAALVMALIAMPTALLPGTQTEPAAAVALLGLLAALFTGVEYHVRAPSFLEFRGAPPYNRLRFGTLLLLVFLLSVLLRDATLPTTLTRAVTLTARAAAHLFDFPGSPLRLLSLAPPVTAAPQAAETLRLAAGLAFAVSVLAGAGVALALHRAHWPGRRESFNIWVNLPTFDPTGEPDVVARLRRDAQLNVLLGLLMPFLVPALLKLVSDLFLPLRLEGPHTLLWTVTAWAFLPVSLTMRGVALARLAGILAAQRRRAHAAAEGEAMQPA